MSYEQSYLYRGLARAWTVSGVRLRLLLVVAIVGSGGVLATPPSAADSGPIDAVSSGNHSAAAQQTIAPGGGEGNAVIGWGTDYLGGVGVGDTSPEMGNTEVLYPTPVAVTPGLAGRTITKVVSAWGAGTCALASGDLVCWRYRQLAEIEPDTAAFGGGSVTDFDMNDDGMCAISAGKAYCRGRNDYGQLGNNSLNGSAVFVPVWDKGALAGRSVQQIGFGAVLACALADNQVFCWGNDYSGQLGNGATGSGTNSSVPVAVDTTGALKGLKIDQIAVGSYGACALAQGRVYCWGTEPTLGSVGSPGETISAVPREIDTSGALSGKTITKLDMKGGTACVLANGAPFCWGVGVYSWGQGTSNSQSLLPVQVKSPALTGKTATDLVVGAATCVLVSGAPVCWGSDASQLGIGTDGHTDEPVATYPGGALSGRTITKLGGGGYAAFAITAEPPGMPTAAGTFATIQPARVLDTRAGIGASARPVPGLGQVAVKVAGINGVPANASAIAANLTVTGAAQGGYLTASPAGQPTPPTSSLNFPAGRTVANMTVTKVGTGGSISIVNGSPGAAQVIVDVTGYYLGGTPNTPGAFHPLRPDRLLDTRSAIGAPRAAVQALQSVDLQAAGRAGIPSSGVSAVVLNVTATGADAGGFVTVFPTASERPGTSNLNFAAGTTVAAQVVVPLGQDGKVALFNGSPGQVQLIADVAGYYLAGTPTAAGAFVPIVPTRLIDTRIGLGSTGRLPSLAERAVTTAGQGGLPRWANAATAINTTIVNPSAEGFASIRPAETMGAPTTSTVNFSAFQTVANMAATPSFSKVTNGSSGSIDFVVDAFGYFHN